MTNFVGLIATLRRHFGGKMYAVTSAVSKILYIDLLTFVNI